MLRRSKQIVAIIIMQIILVRSYGQPNLSPTVPSPNAASLGQYTDLPVSYFTGVPDISIPLYEVAGNKIKLPISMSYHAVGLRPDIHPGWVGNGWSLQAGGTITRKMNQMMDEMQYVFDVNGNGQYYMRMSDWASDAKVKTNNFYANLYPLDVEPDEFDFNFLGYSGKFFLDQNGTWRVQSDQYIKVVFELTDLVTPFLNNVSGYSINTTGIIKTFGKFTLIDGNGNKYVFGSTDVNTSAIEYSGTMIVPTNQRGSNNFFATSWNLTQIISSDGSEVINLNYERGPFTSQLSYSAMAYQTTSGCGTTGPHSAGISGTVISPVYLASITMPSRNIQVSFSKSQTNELRYVLNGSAMDPYVRVYQDAGYTSQQISSIVGTEFPSFYTLITTPSVIPYFGSNAAPTNFWDRFIWLKLNSMNVMDTRTGTAVQAVNFVYNESSSKRLSLKRLAIDDKNYTFYYNPLSLPNYITIFGDHWGFNNEGNHSSNFIPPFTSQGQGWPPGGSMYAIREPDPTGIKTQAEILTDLFYPTGGKLHIDYEPNTYATVVKRDIGTTATAETGVAGGLRVKQISKTNDFGPEQQTSFFYVNNYNSSVVNPGQLPSSGVLDSKPAYNFTRTGTGNYGGSNTAVSMTQYQTSSVIPLTSNSMSNHIGYSTVVEKRSDGAYSIYQFSNHETSPTSTYNDISAVNSFNAGFFDGYLISTSNYFKRGKLLQRTDYTANDNKVSEEINTYANSGPDILTNAVHQYGMTVCPPQAGGIYATDIYAKTAYNIVSTNYLLSSTTKKEYSSNYSGNAITRTVNYLYDQFRNVTNQTTTNSQGQEVVTAYRYAHEFYSPTNSLNLFTMMKNMNNVNALLEKKTTVSGNVVGAELYTYQANGLNKFYPDAIYKAELKEPVYNQSFTSTTSNDAGDLFFDNRYKKMADVRYDASGNLTSLLKSGNEPASFIWDYNVQFPTAKVVNAKNIYAVTPDPGPVTTVSQNISVTNTQYVNYQADIYVNNGASPATLNLSFAYNNPFISGNNYSMLSWHIFGLTDPNYHVNNTLCAATNSGTCPYGSPNVVVSNVPAGSYRVHVTLVSYTGFNNYYGYKFTVSYPSTFQTPSVVADNQVAHTSFEYLNASELNAGTGNISGVQFSSIQSGTAVTGNRYYALTGGNTLTKSDLDMAKTYIVSYWTNGTQLSVTGTQSSTQTAALSFGNWKCFQHKVSGVSTISVSGSAGIDELRIYPLESQMTTYTYQPLQGVTSICDANNIVTYYEYDAVRRLKVIRDKDRNIFKSFEYKY
jgi:hypothetical protein